MNRLGNLGFLGLLGFFGMLPNASSLFVLCFLFVFFGFFLVTPRRTQIKTIWTSELSDFGWDKHRVVNIGSMAGRICKVAEDCVIYEDATKERRRICLQPSRPDSPAGRIGYRKLDQAPWAVKLTGDEIVVFVFESYVAAYELLLVPLGRMGLSTSDST